MLSKAKQAPPTTNSAKSDGVNSQTRWTAEHSERSLIHSFTHSFSQTVHQSVSPSVNQQTPPSAGPCAGHGRYQEEKTQFRPCRHSAQGANTDRLINNILCPQIVIKVACTEPSEWRHAHNKDTVTQSCYVRTESSFQGEASRLRRAACGAPGPSDGPAGGPACPKGERELGHHRQRRRTAIAGVQRGHGGAHVHPPGGLGCHQPSPPQRHRDGQRGRPILGGTGPFLPARDGAARPRN